ncbi:MAG TPA: rhodanese-like domain-containing protein [Anaeromyxobacter sp.]|nr:rhodanese-like domain-containing protein [Anaeromyxobacter sp.]
MRPFVLATILALSLAGPARAKDPPDPGSALGVEPGVVDAATARRLVAAGVKVVDVRTPAEFDKGHVPGAVNIPYDEMERRAGELGPPTTPLLLYCQSGRRSEIAIRTLKGKGFTRLYDLRAYRYWVESKPRRGDRSRWRVGVSFAGAERLTLPRRTRAARRSPPPPAGT